MFCWVYDSLNNGGQRPSSVSLRERYFREDPESGDVCLLEGLAMALAKERSSRQRRSRQTLARPPSLGQWLLCVLDLVRYACRAIRAPSILLRTAIRRHLVMNGLQRGQSVLLQKSQQSPAAGAHTPSPLESLQSFSKLSLGSSPVPSQCCAESGTVVAAGRHIPPQTLVASYRLDPTKPRPVPKVCIALIW